MDQGVEWPAMVEEGSDHELRPIDGNPTLVEVARGLNRQNVLRIMN